MRRVARPLLYVGTVAIVLGLAKVHARYIGHYVLHSTEPWRLVWTIGYLGMLMVASYGVGLPELPRTSRQVLTSATLAPVLAAGSISAVQLIAGDALLPRFVVFGAVLLLVPWNLACIAIARGGRSQGERRDRVILVAPDAEAVTLRDELHANPERPAVLVRALTVAGAGASSAKHDKPLVEAVLDAGGSVVVLDRTALVEPSVVSQAASLHESGIRVRTLSLFYEEWLGKLPLTELERASLLFDIRELHGPRYVRVKRMLDIAVGLVGLVALIVVEPFVLLGNVFGNRGPLLFKQERVGKNGRVFEVLKFRTMRAGDPGPTTWTQADDPRITPFGKVLRKTHVDELPQLWNVLFGQLSIVGPRPEQPRYVEELTAKLPFYGLRHLVRPGLTGWAQVKYGYAGDEHDALEKLQYDFWYLRHQSVGLDARILGRTVRSVLGSQGKGR